MATPSTDAPLLDGQVALVTGAAGGGIGSASARALAAQGGRLALNGLPRQLPELERLAASIESESGRQAIVAAGDVARAGDVRAVVEGTLAAFGRLDIVVHNAAPSLPRTPIEAMSDERWREELGTILDGAFFVCREAMPALAEHRGRVVLVSSSAAERGTWGRGVAYAAAKAGLLGLTRQLALEAGAAGVRVNAVVPSQIDTPRVRRGGRRDDASLAAAARRIPLQRVGQPEDVADAIVFLASPMSGYVTGETLAIDGGSRLAAATTRTREPEHTLVAEPRA